MVYHRPVEKYHTLSALLREGNGAAATDSPDNRTIESCLPEASDFALEVLACFCTDMLMRTNDRYFDRLRVLAEDERRRRRPV